MKWAFEIQIKSIAYHISQFLRTDFAPTSPCSMLPRYLAAALLLRSSWQVETKNSIEKTVEHFFDLKEALKHQNLSLSDAFDIAPGAEDSGTKGTNLEAAFSVAHEFESKDTFADKQSSIPGHPVHSQLSGMHVTITEKSTQTTNPEHSQTQFKDKASAVVSSQTIAQNPNSLPSLDADALESQTVKGTSLQAMVDAQSNMNNVLNMKIHDNTIRVNPQFSYHSQNQHTESGIYGKPKFSPVLNGFVKEGSKSISNRNLDAIHHSLDVEMPSKTELSGGNDLTQWILNIEEAELLQILRKAFPDLQYSQLASSSSSEELRAGRHSSMPKRKHHRKHRRKAIVQSQDSSNLSEMHPSFVGTLVLAIFLILL